VEKYKNYLKAFSAFVLSFNYYKYNLKLSDITGNSKELPKFKKDLKKKATVLKAEFKKIPEALQLPEIENKINEALAL
jgi:hypothetical protein